MNTTILNVIDELFNKKGNENKPFTFDEIFQEVEKKLLTKWSSHNDKLFTPEKIRKNKMGETYKLLTIDGRFIRHEDGTWTKRKINESL